MGGGGTETKTVCQTVSDEVNTKMQQSTQCRACGTINISKSVNIFLSTTPTTFILTSLVSEFCQRYLNLNSVCQKQNVKCGKIQKSKHLHTVEHVVQSTFQNMLITFEFSSK